ncbi:MAG: Glu/Leu/Phe/Val dehydrogenase, partial [Chloroflexi bacterium]|nr:Glu/Leu/Phe/Val dehydrogenase [Chloroflexota bacterium]
RMWTYPSEAVALTDVLRLSRAMTYKAAVANLPLGGGKGLILGDPHADKTERLLRAYGRAVNSLGGRYITAEDVGTSPDDLTIVMQETQWIVGKPLEVGGSGDSAPATGFGVYQAMRACAKEVYGDPSLEGKSVALQGFGKVASNLAHYLKKDRVRLIVSEVYPESRRRAVEEFGAEVVAPEAIYDVPCDIFSPNALGGVLNRETIPRLRCKIVTGGANNQLLEPLDGDRLRDAGILYAPDYVANAGGIINLSFELTTYDAKAAMDRVSLIYETVEEVIAVAKAQGLATSAAADRLAEARLAQAAKARTG